MSSPAPLQLLQAHLEALLPQALDWLKRMVGINSFTTNPAGVNQLGALTAEMFTPLGFTPESRASLTPNYGSHLFLKRGPAHQLPVLLVTHLDTVYPSEEEQRNDFHWQEVPAERRIYGPGIVDNKGGTIMIWMILRALQEFAPALFESTAWIIAANSCEEVIGSEFARLCGEHCPQGARAVLVFEGGPREGNLFDIVTSRKGRAEYRITAEGRAAHAGSSHHKGVNAVVALSNLVGPTAALTDYARELTVNVAVIHGGTVLNRVPHEAVAELEMRAYEPALLKETGDRIRELAADSKIAGGASIEVEQTGLSPAWPGGAQNEALFRCWYTAAKELDLSVRPVPRGGLSDANYLYHLGPTLDGLGPNGANAHCSERSADGSKLPEYVDDASFVPKAAINVLAMTRLLGE
jgi:glutamate carboxypeptidase